MPPTTAGTSTRTGSVPTEAAKCDLGESSWISTALSMAGGHRRPDTAGEEWMSGDDADGAMKGGCSRGFPEGQAVDIERKSRRREEGLGRRGRRAGQWGTGGSLRLLVVVLAVLLSTASSQLTPIIARCPSSPPSLPSPPLPPRHQTFWPPAFDDGGCFSS